MHIFMYQWNLPKRFYENLKKRFVNKYKFCDHDINKFIKLSQKGVYPNEYIDD